MYIIQVAIQLVDWLIDWSINLLHEWPIACQRARNRHIYMYIYDDWLDIRLFSKVN